MRLIAAIYESVTIASCALKNRYAHVGQAKEVKKA